MIVGGIRLDEEISFDEIDKKVAYINANKHNYDDVIRELNSLIDLDYIKASEFIEGNTLNCIEEFDMDENPKVLRAFPSFISDLPKDRLELEAFIKNMRYDSDKTSLVILKKANPEDLEFKSYCCEMPKHLPALEMALSQARFDRKVQQSGRHMPDVTKKFIEEINGRFFEKTEHKDEPGYGTFRSLMFINGDWRVVPNVEVGGANWKPCDSVNVPGEMMKLLDFYNNSNLHPILKAIIFKTRFIQIHPFRDGNGRTSRILLNYMLVRYGYPTITITGNEKYVYLNAMQKAISEGNYTELLKMVVKHLNERCDKYIQIINEEKELREKEEQEIE